MTENFEDVGHSTDAREMMAEYYIGELSEVGVGVCVCVCVGVDVCVGACTVSKSVSKFTIYYPVCS